MTHDEPRPGPEPEGGKLPCTVCRREVPADEALSEEAREMVYYFCGTDCLEAWRREAGERYAHPDDERLD